MKPYSVYSKQYVKQLNIEDSGYQSSDDHDADADNAYYDYYQPYANNSPTEAKNGKFGVEVCQTEDTQSHGHGN